ncbi:MAG: LysR family transcriptional regulator [Oxalobacteraceae bacterium]|nr:LysR family transcriptional regulator [Oxalobacteraceae bacterium]
MHKVSIKPQWTISDADGQNLTPRLLELLAEVQGHGSLSGSCKKTGASYRHAWSLIRQGEAQLGMPLLNMERGKGSTLTPLAEKLVWAGHRINARLTPMLETLASELESEIGRLLSSNSETLRVHASHGFAVEKMIENLKASGLQVERKYVGSIEAVASLQEGACEIAGFHIPQGEFEETGFKHYSRWLIPKQSRIIHVATRRQGFMVASGNPHKIYEVQDLTRKGLRFVNRQPSSGTRFLLECFLKKAQVDPSQIAGYEQAEFTHAAVAAYVASGMADVGFGVQTAAERFKLDFIPLACERYFFAVNAESLDQPGMRQVIDVVRSNSFRDAVHQLAGYDATDTGEILTLSQAFNAAPRKQAA